MGIKIETWHKHKGLLVASFVWLICLAAAVFGTLIRQSGVSGIVSYALIASIPAFLTIGLIPFMQREWAQVLVIFGWLALAIIACLAIAFVPMALLFLCAPAAAALFEREKVVEALFLSALFAAILYYVRTQGLSLGAGLATEAQSDWGVKAGIASTVGFLIAAIYGSSSEKTHKWDAIAAKSGEVLDALPDAVLTLGPDNTIGMATDKAQSLLNLPVGKGAVSIHEVFNEGRVRTSLVRIIDIARSNGHTNSDVIDYTLEGDVVKSAQVTAAPLANGDVLLTFSDKTEHFNELSRLRDENHRAKQEKDDKTLFFAGVSHELRTPLNAIIGFSDMMRSRLFGPLPGKYAEYADLIHDSGQHMLDLIGDVLDLSKVEAGKYDLVYSDFDAADVVRSTIKMIRPTADNAEVRLDAEIIEEPSELLIQADRKAVRQILLNLLSNAIKFTPKGGRIVVGAKEVGNLLNITVSDTGVGMSEEELKHIGSAYYQSESGKNNELRGTGLGLALVKSLTELHGGRFAIASKKGVGTTAAIYLPQLKTGEIVAFPGNQSHG